MLVDAESVQQCLDELNAALDAAEDKHGEDVLSTALAILVESFSVEITEENFL